MTLQIEPDVSGLEDSDERFSGDSGHLSAMLEAQRAVAMAGLELQAVMEVIAARAQSLTKAAGSVIELLEGEEMVYRAACGTTALHVGLRIPAANSLAGHCVRTGETLYCEDTELDPRVNREACRKIAARSMVVVPLYHQGRAAGVLKVLSPRPSAFEKRDLATLRLMTGLLAAALAHASEFAAKRSLLAERTEMLQSVRQANERLRESEARLRESEQLFRSAFDNAPIGMAVAALDGRWRLVNAALCDIVGYSEQELLARDFQSITHPDDLIADLGYIRQQMTGEIGDSQRVKRYVHRRGHIVWVQVGVSLLRDEQGEPLYFVVQIQDITQRKQAEWLERDRRHVLEMVTRNLPLPDVVNQLAGAVQRQVGGSVAAVMLLEDGRVSVHGPNLHSGWRAVLEEHSLRLAVRLSDGLSSRSDTCGVTYLDSDAAWEGLRTEAARQGLETCWVVPARSTEDVPLGLLMLFCCDRRPPSAPELETLHMAGTLAAISIEHHNTARQLAHLVRHDVLTGLPNRLLFEDRIQQALALARRSRKTVGVLVLDVDRFKSINDTLGHQGGDHLLQQFASRLRGVLRETDTMARLGGDEFVIILPELNARKMLRSWRRNWLTQW